MIINNFFFVFVSWIILFSYLVHTIFRIWSVDCGSIDGLAYVYVRLFGKIYDHFFFFCYIFLFYINNFFDLSFWFSLNMHAVRFILRYFNMLFVVTGFQFNIVDLKKPNIESWKMLCYFLGVNIRALLSQ